MARVPKVVSLGNVVGSKARATTRQAKGDQEVSNRIFTIPNAISFIRLCLVPVFLVLLLNGFNIAATIVFAVAAATDFLDGQIARRTNSVTKLGQLLDPIVDRALMICGVVGLFLVGRIPLWIILLVLGRDLLMLGGGAWLLFGHGIRVPVIYPGKVATTFLFVGFAGLLLNWPLIPGLGVSTFSWLPGFTAEPVSWGIWFIYAGLLLAIITTAYYCYAGLSALKKKNAAEAKASMHG